MSILKPGDYLDVNQELVSDNGLYRLLVQTDGNLVLYAGAPSLATAVWASDTWNLPPVLRPVRAAMQVDGNFVLTSAIGQPVWATGTYGHPGAWLDLQTDRNLVIYEPVHTPIWATMTNIPPAPKRVGSITASNNDSVGWAKAMQSTAVLYRDGKLVVDSSTRNDNWAGALRGRTLVVVVDGQGRSIWVSQAFEDPTRCSVPDFSCASYGRVTHIEQFPEAVGQYAERIDVYHADNANFVDLRNRLIDSIKAVVEVAQEVKDAWDQLQK